MSSTMELLSHPVVGAPVRRELGYILVMRARRLRCGCDGSPKR